MFNTFYKTFMSVRIIERERDGDGRARAGGFVSFCFDLFSLFSASASCSRLDRFVFSPSFHPCD